MESQQIIDQSINNSSVNLTLNEEAKSFLNETRKWTRFLSIIGFVLVGILILFGIFFETIMDKLLGNTLPSAIPTALIGFFYIVVAIIYAVPMFYLFKFSTNMDNALKSDNEEDLTQSFSYLKSHYKFFGIVTILILSLYGVLIIVGIISALALS